jgi:hypothetical protein
VKRGICAMVMAAVVFGGLLAGAATAASAAASGTVKVYVTPNNTTAPKHPGKVMLTGAIGDYGSVIDATAAGKPTATKKKKTPYRLLRLKKGTILVNISTFQSKLTSAYSSPSGFNSTTCSLSVDVSGSISVVSGTGAYTGITGSFVMTGHIGGISRRTKSGSCTTKTTTPPAATYISIIGSGTVTVP